MRIGVAVATFNGARFVRAQMQSIAAQQRRPDHVVVADDGSTDETVVIVAEVCADQGLPLELLRGDTRLGVVANFERAIRAVDADVIVLSDQDDVWHDDKLAVIERTFAARAGVGGVFSDGRIVDDAGVPTGRTLWESFGYGGEDDLLRVLLKKNVVTGATLAFAAAERDLVLPLSPDGWHDGWIAVLVAATAGLIPIGAPLVDYRVHSANAEGLGTRGVADAVAQRNEGRKPRELRHFESLVSRLRERRPDRAGAIALLDAKVAHLQHRCSLPANAAARAWRIGRLLPEYSRFSSSWRSPLLDLLAPAAAS